MIKLRQAGYCNLKLFLLYLVVYGHWIENQIGTSDIIRTQYRFIYLFHMPLFVFLSGLFLRNQKDCLRQIKRLLPIYVVLQIAASFYYNGSMQLHTPWWHLWYLLSYCSWAFFGWLWFCICKGKFRFLFLILSILAGVLAGFFPKVNRIFSLSRTVVLFPYFFAGLLCSPDTAFTNYRCWGLTAFILGIVTFALLGERIPTTFFYHATGYGTLEHGFFLRLLCYVLGGLLSFFFLTCIPLKRLPCTRAGSDTLPGFLLHAPFVLIFREFRLPWIVCAFLSAVFLYYLYKLLQWDSPLFGIISLERRERHWPNFRKSTNNTANRSTGIFSP